jgi:hypothetical protein
MSTGSTLIQIKRSQSTATPTSLANGELSYTANGDIFFIGRPDGSNTVTAIGGRRYPGTLTANQALVANSTSGIDKIIVANAVITSIYANGSVGTSGQVLTSNSTGGVYWLASGALGVNTDAQYTFTNTITFSNTVTFNSTISGSINGSANAAMYLNGKTESNLNVNNALTSNNASYLGGTIASSYATKTYADGVGSTAYSNATSYADGVGSTTYTNAITYANTAAYNAYSNAMSDTLSRNGTYTGNNTLAGTTTTISSNASFTGSVALGDATSDIISFNGRVNTSIVPSANISYNLGTTLLRFNTINASNVSSVDGNFTGDVSVGGNLTVSGTLTTVDTVNLKVKDALIELADNNNTSDSLEIGFFGRSGNSTATFYHGLVRDHATSPTVGSAYFRLFSTNTAPSTTVDTTASGYAQGTLFAYLNSGGLVSNTTAVNITANSSVSVALVANTLTLSTALAGTSGGTGYNTYTSGDLLVANTGNTLSKLSIGTDGYVLQVSGGALVYGGLDGGTF